MFCGIQLITSVLVSMDVNGSQYFCFYFVSLCVFCMGFVILLGFAFLFWLFPSSLLFKTLFLSITKLQKKTLPNHLRTSDILQQMLTLAEHGKCPIFLLVYSTKNGYSDTPVDRSKRRKSESFQANENNKYDLLRRAVSLIKASFLSQKVICDEIMVIVISSLKVRD